MVLVVQVPKSDGLGPNGEPSKEQVAKVHGEYVARLKALFDESKGQFGFGDRDLVIE